MGGGRILGFKWDEWCGGERGRDGDGDGGGSLGLFGLVSVRSWFGLGGVVHVRWLRTVFAKREKLLAKFSFLQKKG